MLDREVASTIEGAAASSRSTPASFDELRVRDCSIKRTSMSSGEVNSWS
jgi:hypothetical protein